MQNAGFGCLVALGCLAWTATAASAQENCTTVQFSKGTSSTTVKGQAPAEEAVCYTLAVRPGQTVNLKISGRNMVISVIDVGDDRALWTFRATKPEYKFIVAQEMRAVSPQSYTLTVAVH